MTEINISDYTINEIKEALAKVQHTKAYRKEYYAANREHLLEKEKSLPQGTPRNRKEQIQSKERRPNIQREAPYQERKDVPETQRKISRRESSAL